MNVLVLRPAPDNKRTAAEIAAIGWRAILFPCFSLEPLDGAIPPGEFDALLLTSANAVRFGGKRLDGLRALPCIAVGDRTAEAAGAAGFVDVRTGGGSMAATVPMIREAGFAHLLHPCGQDWRAFDEGALSIVHLPVYASVPQGDAGELAAALAGREPLVVLVHSPRAGARVAALIAPEDRARAALVAISPTALAAAGRGWRRMACAAAPTEAAMLAIAQKLV